MKKLLAILLVLAFVGVAYAQDEAPALKFSGYVDTGLAYTIVGSADGLVTLDGDDSGKISRINLDASYTNENVGLVVRYRVEGDLSTNLNPFVNRGYVWAKLFNDMLKVNAGKLADYSWASFGNDIGNLNTLTGVQVLLMPTTGLTLGFFVPATGTGVTAEDTMKSMVFGGEYALEGVGAFRAGSDLSDTGMAWFSADITAVENFEFILDYEASDIGGVAISHYLFEEVDYTMDALNVGIDLEQIIVKDAPLFMTFGPYVSYTLDTLVLGGDFTYAMNTEKTPVPSASGMYFHPYAKYTVGTNSVVELGAKINTGDYKTDFDVLADDTTKVYLDFTWKF